MGEYATVGDLKQAICAKMGVPYYDITLSQNKALVSSSVLLSAPWGLCSSPSLCCAAHRRGPQQVHRPGSGPQALASGRPGARVPGAQRFRSCPCIRPRCQGTALTQVQLLYPFKRRVEATVKPSVFGTHGFGALRDWLASACGAVLQLTAGLACRRQVHRAGHDRSPDAHRAVGSLVASWTDSELPLTPGASRQETSHCTSVSFDKHAANAFQSYVMQMHAFSIKRGGILYGTVAEDGGVKVHAIYEPPQVRFLCALQCAAKITTRCPVRLLLYTTVT